MKRDELLPFVGRTVHIELAKGDLMGTLQSSKYNKTHFVLTKFGFRREW